MKRTNRLEKPRRQNWCRYSAHDSAVCPRNKLNSIIAMQCIRKPVVRIQCRWAYSYGTCKCAILSHTIHVYSRIIYETCAGTYAAYKLWGVESKWVLLHSAFGVLTSAHWKDKKKKAKYMCSWITYWYWKPCVLRIFTIWFRRPNWTMKNGSHQWQTSKRHVFIND